MFKKELLVLRAEQPSIKLYKHRILVRLEIKPQLPLKEGARGGVVVKELRYKPAGRGFDSRWCHWNFSVTILPVALWSWGRLNL